MRNAPIPRPLLCGLLCASLAFPALRAIAQTETVVSFSNPAGVPTGHLPDDDGVLVPTSQSFAEGGMHVESFWVKNDETAFSQGHFHHVENGYETTHGFATVPGLGSDRLGVFVQREDGGAFDLVSLDYQLRLQLLATDVLVSTSYDPSQPAPPQFEHFPVVKQPTFQTLAVPGFAGVTSLFVLFDVGENGNLEHARLDNLVFSLPPASCSPAVAPGVVYAHDGTTDPELEGWTREGAAVGVAEGPLALDFGFDAWAVDDDSADPASTLSFALYPDADVMCWARTSGFTLRARVRVSDVPDDPGGSVSVSFFDSRWLYELRLGSEADGDPIVEVSGASAVLDGLGAGHHLYEMVYDPAARKVDLLADGAEVLSDRPGVAKSVDAPRIAFASSGGADTGQGNFARVELALPERCGNRIDDDGDGRVDFPADPGCTSPADGDETGACGNGLDDDGDGLADVDDPGCAGSDDAAETAPELTCDDGADNDGDAAADFPGDPGCASLLDPSETTACDDGFDDDGDGAVDFPDDPGCAGALDDSERSDDLACDNGADDDGDGASDYPNDPGCGGSGAPRENPQCQDGLDNDGDGRRDFDGGASLNGGVPLSSADLQCAGTPSRDSERPSLCGLGFEVAFVLPLLVAARRRAGARSAR